MGAALVIPAVLIGLGLFIAGKYLHRGFAELLQRVKLPDCQGTLASGGFLTYPRLVIPVDDVTISVSAIAGGGRAPRLRRAPVVYATARSERFGPSAGTLRSVGFLSIVPPGPSDASVAAGATFDELFETVEGAAAIEVAGYLSSSARESLVELARCCGPVQLVLRNFQLTLSLRGIPRDPGSVERLVQTFRSVLSSVVSHHTRTGVRRIDARGAAPSPR
jgi:hypothetical protein